MPPLVSILIPCYNAERWVGQAIESALAQTWGEKEVIVVDDGSTDASLQAIKKFGNRIRWETGPNRGGNRARNRLLELAQGEWLQYLDADDYLLPDKIERQVEFRRKNPDVDVIYSRIIVENSSSGNLKTYLSEISDPQDPWTLLVRWDLGQTGGPLFRKRAIMEVGAWKPEQKCCQEHELFLRLLMASKRFAYCQDYGAVYRQWSQGSVCTRNIQDVHFQRLKIITEAEEFLQARDELNRNRLWAINHARLEIARLLWQYNSSSAAEVALTIRRSQPNFVPGGPGARTKYPLRYRIGYRLIGFQAAEKLADLVRFKFKSRSASASSTCLD